MRPARLWRRGSRPTRAGPGGGGPRGALGAAEREAGRPAEAERLARAEVERLLAADRKDRLAEIDHAFALRLLHPDERTVPPDPAGARALLEQALHLARGDALRARLRFEMARA